MKSDFKTKLIQHMLNKKNGEKGFTLIELLVVIIIIGILAAIALPSFLNQANKARQSEAKSYVGSINRAQQAYYLEKSQFSPSLASLGLGIAASTDNYGYTISTAAAGTAAAATTGLPAAATVAALPVSGNSLVNAYGVPKKPALKGYAGVTWLGTTSGNESTTTAALYESTAASPTDATGTTVTGIALASLPAGTAAPTIVGMDTIK